MAVTQSEVTNAGGLDPKLVLRVILRRKWLILLVFVSVVSAVTLYTTRQPKVYAAQISIIMDAKEPRFLDSQIQDVNADTYSNYWANKEAVETQFKVMQSRAVAQRVVEKLGLNRDAAFLGLSKLTDEKQRLEVMGKIDAVAILQGKIRAEQVKDSRVALIKIEDSEPNRAALLANEVAQAFADETLAQRLKLTENAQKWLDERRDSLSTQTRASELALYDFRRQADMLSGSIDDRSTMVSSRLSATSNALTEVQLKIAGMRARVAAIRNVQASQGAEDRLWAEALPAARENVSLTGYKTRFLTLKNECSDLQTRYLEGHPKLMECRERLASAEKDFARELSNLVISTEAELKEAVEKERNLQALFLAAKTEAFEVEKKKLELDRLRSDSDSNKRQYEAVFKRLKDIELSGLLRTSNVRVLDSARPQLGAIRPNVPQSILMGIVAGLVAGLGLALLLEFMDSSVTTQQEIEERLGLTFLGFIPTIPETANAVRDLHMHREPKSLIAECTRAMRTNLLVHVARQALQAHAGDVERAARGQVDHRDEPGHRHGPERHAGAHRRHRHAPAASAQGVRRAQRHGRVVAGGGRGEARRRGEVDRGAGALPAAVWAGASEPGRAAAHQGVRGAAGQAGREVRPHPAGQPAGRRRG